MVSKTDLVSNIRTAVSETIDKVLKHAVEASVVIIIIAAAAEVIAVVAVIAPVDIAAKVRPYNLLHITRSSFCGKENLALFNTCSITSFTVAATAAAMSEHPSPPTAKTRLQGQHDRGDDYTRPASLLSNIDAARVH